MGQIWTTGKEAQYSGKGPNPALLLLGEHAPPKSPFRYFPWDPYRAMMMDTAWFYTDWRVPYSSTYWTETKTGAGTTIAPTTDAALLFTNDAADNDAGEIQHLHTFTPAANAFAACYFRARISDATQSDWYMGFWSTDTSPVASEPADSAFFKKDDGDTILNGRTNDAGGAGSETSNLDATILAATDYDLGIILLPSSGTAGTAIFCYKLASATAWSQATKTTDFPDAAVRLSMLIQNGEGVAKTMTVKRWAYCAYQP